MLLIISSMHKEEKEEKKKERERERIENYFLSDSS